MDRKIISAKAVAEKFDVTEAHVRRLAQQGRLPHFRIGSAYRFFEDEIDAFLERHRVRLEDAA